MSNLISAQSTLTDRYQTTIPEIVRNVLNLSKRDKLVYSVDSEGKVVISKLTSCEDDPVLNNFLSFLAKDIENSPQNLVPMTAEKFMKISSLVEDIKIDLEAPLDGDDGEWKVFLEDIFSPRLWEATFFSDC